jgi:hypothetical protein
MNDISQRPDVTPSAGAAPVDRAELVEVQHGFEWSGSDVVERIRVIDAAFDYRGDVTLGLRDGSEVVGYLSNREAGAADPYLEIFPRDGSPRRRIGYVEVQRISFSGKDPATGRSWQTWIEKWKLKKEAEARGESVGDISLFPEHLDD